MERKMRWEWLKWRLQAKGETGGDGKDGERLRRYQEFETGQNRGNLSRRQRL